MKKRKNMLILGVCCLPMLTMAACSSSGTEAREVESAYSAEGSAECHVKTDTYETTYTVLVKVGTDASGNIVYVVDNGTNSDPDSKGKYKKATKIFENLIGANSDTLSETDVISGATVSAEAILEAVGNALEVIDGERSVG